MADEREESQEEPKIRVIDNRMLSEDERSGIASGVARDDDQPTAPPKLEIIGGGKNDDAPAQAISEDTDDEDELSDDEREEMRAELEKEQFAQFEEQMGRPLTDKEKEEVRSEMKRQAESVTKLEVLPLAQQLMAEMSARAAVHMGLMPNPYTRLVARNDSEARLAIDTFGAVLNVVESKLQDAESKEYNRVLNDLKTNFVNVTGGSIGEPTGPRIIH